VFVVSVSCDRLRTKQTLQHLSDKNKMQVIHHSNLKHLCINSMWRLTRAFSAAVLCCRSSDGFIHFQFLVILRKNYQVAEVKKFGDCDPSRIFSLRQGFEMLAKSSRTMADSLGYRLQTW